MCGFHYYESWLRGSNGITRQFESSVPPSRYDGAGLFTDRWNFIIFLRFLRCKNFGWKNNIDIQIELGAIKYTGETYRYTTTNSFSLQSLFNLDNSFIYTINFYIYFFFLFSEMKEKETHSFYVCLFFRAKFLAINWGIELLFIHVQLEILTLIYFYPGSLWLWNASGENGYCCGRKFKKRTKRFERTTDLFTCSKRCKRSKVFKRWSYIIQW